MCDNGKKLCEWETRLEKLQASLCEREKQLAANEARKEGRVTLVKAITSGIIAVLFIAALLLTIERLVEHPDIFKSQHHCAWPVDVRKGDTVLIIVQPKAK